MGVRVKAIGWDVDGVLRPIDIIVSNFVDTFVWFLRERRIKADERSVTKFTPQIKSLERKRMFDYICGRFGLKRLSEKDFRKFNDYYKRTVREKILRSPMVRDAQQAIVFFGKRGYRQFIATAAPKQEIVMWFLKQTGCRPYIQVIYGPTLTGSMNKTDAIRDFCRKNNLPTSAVAFVGDAPFDVVAARKAGAKAVYLATKREKAPAIRPHRRINSISQITRIIQMGRKPRRRR